jgi:methionyl-tRNA formyltransferase
MKKYTVAIAGSTSHTTQCIDAILTDGLFEVVGVLTPSPKLVSRKQVLTKNAVHLLAEEKNWPVVLIEQKIDRSVEEKIIALPQPDFLLVVDFGYLVPPWLLQLPKIAPINIHPSDLPRWRGASPGQFVLLYGEKESAVSIIVMGEGLDDGPIIHKEFFAVDPQWTQTEYYHFAFNLIGKVLAKKMVGVAEGSIVPSDQPAQSSTPQARRLTKDDGFVEWKILASTLNSKSEAADETSLLLKEVFAQVKNWSQVISNATHAFLPWPGVWTMVEVGGVQKRMKILDAELSKGKLELLQVQLEGQTPTSWNQVKNVITNG